MLSICWLPTQLYHQSVVRVHTSSTDINLGLHPSIQHYLLGRLGRHLSQYANSRQIVSSPYILSGTLTRVEFRKFDGWVLIVLFDSVPLFFMHHYAKYQSKFKGA